MKKDIHKKYFTLHDIRPILVVYENLVPFYYFFSLKKRTLFLYNIKRYNQSLPCTPFLYGNEVSFMKNHIFSCTNTGVFPIYFLVQVSKSFNETIYFLVQVTNNPIHYF